VLGNWWLGDKRRCCERREVVYVEGMRYLICESEGRQCGASEHMFDRKGRVMAPVLT